MEPSWGAYFGTSNLSTIILSTWSTHCHAAVPVRPLLLPPPSICVRPIQPRPPMFALRPSCPRLPSQPCFPFGPPAATDMCSIALHRIAVAQVRRNNDAIPCANRWIVTDVVTPPLRCHAKIAPPPSCYPCTPIKVSVPPSSHPAIRHPRFPAIRPASLLSATLCRRRQVTPRRQVHPVHQPIRPILSYKQPGWPIIRPHSTCQFVQSPSHPPANPMPPALPS